MITYTLFGTTTGLELVHYPQGDVPAQLKLDSAWIEVSDHQVTLLPDTDALVVTRKAFGPHLITWMGIYRPAREIGYDRQGGYVGAGAWLVDATADSRLLIDILRPLLQQVQAKAMRGDKFERRISDMRAEFILPTEAARLATTLARIPGGCQPDGAAAFVAVDGDPAEVLTWAQTAKSATEFSKVLIGSLEQAPASGQAGAVQVYRSLARAIEGAYRFHVGEIASLSEKNDRLAKENNKVVFERDNAKNELSRFSNDLASTRQLHAEAERKLTQFEAELRRRNDDLSRLRERIHTLQEELKWERMGPKVPQDFNRGPQAPNPQPARDPYRPGDSRDHGRQTGRNHPRMPFSGLLIVWFVAPSLLVFIVVLALYAFTPLFH